MPDENSGQKPVGNTERPPLPLSESPRTPQQSHLREAPENNSADGQNDSKELVREIHWVEKATMISQFLLAIIGTFALIIYHGQLSVMQQQVDQAKNQVTIMQRQLESSDRPWIKVISLEPKSKFSILGDNAGDFIPGVHGMFSYLLVVKNIGRSVALNLSARVELTFTEDEKRLLQEQKGMCSTVFGETLGILNAPVTTLFPDEDSGSTFSIEGSAIVPIENGTRTGLISPKINGCVSYTIPGSNRTHHSSLLFGIQPKQGTGLLFFAEPGIVIAPKDLVAIKYPFGFSAE